MNEITAILPQVKDKKRCNIYIDGRFCCGLTLEATVKNRLKVGQTVSPQRLSQIQLESEKNTALDKAMTHLSASRKTEKQIREFVSKKGYLEDVTSYVIEKLNEYHFLNDKEYAENYVEHTSQRKGVRLIRVEMRKKGLSEEDMDAALDGIDEETQLNTAREVLEKYMRHKEVDKTTLQKAIKYLLGKGFEFEIAKKAVLVYGEPEEEDF